MQAKFKSLQRPEEVGVFPGAGVPSNCDPLMLVLGTELRSPARKTRALNLYAVSILPLLLLMFLLMFVHRCRPWHTRGGQRTTCGWFITWVASKHWTQVLRLGGKCLFFEKPSHWTVLLLLLLLYNVTTRKSYMQLTYCIYIRINWN